MIAQNFSQLTPVYFIENSLEGLRKVKFSCSEHQLDNHSEKY